MFYNLSRLSLFLAAVLLGVTLAPIIQAQTTLAAPPLLNFQGRLAKPDGTPVSDGTYAIRFSLWDVAAGGNAANEKWSQTVSNLNVKNGTFATALNVGTVAGLFNTNLWMEIKIGSDAPLTPRQQLVSVAYALKANSVPDNAIGTGNLLNNAVTNAKINDVAWSKITGIPASILNPWSLLGNSGTNPTSHFLGTTDNQPLAFRTNNSEQLRITADGNLGLNLNRYLSYLPTDSFLYDGDTVGHYSLGWFNDSWNAAGSTAWLSGYAGIKLFSSGQSRLTLTQSGNVGIGTETPTARLDVNGAVNIRSTNQLKLGSDVAGKEANAGTLSYQKFGDSLEIVGAGTTGSNRKITLFSEGGLTAQGNVFLPKGVIQNGSTAVTGTTDLGLYSQIANKWLRFVTNSGDIRFFTDSGIGSSAKMMIYGDGRIGLNRAPYVGTNVSIGDTGLDYSLVSDGKVLAKDYLTISDGRYKKNIAVYGNALETILGLRGVTYDWRKEEFPDRHFRSGKQIGFIAQEVEQIVPELVFTDSTGYKSVNYAQLVPVLTEAIKAQQQQIEELKSVRGENAALRAELDALKAAVAELQRRKK